MLELDPKWSSQGSQYKVRQWPKADWQLSDASEGKQMFESCRT